MWRYEIELDISDPQKDFRLIPEPVADVDGDGSLELILNLYNDGGDGRWHIVIRDGMTGSIEADIVDEIVHGVIDVDGDGAVDLLTAHTQGRLVPTYGTVRIRSLKDGHSRLLWRAVNTAWQRVLHPIRANTRHRLIFSRMHVLSRVLDGIAAAVVRTPVNRDDEKETLSLIHFRDGACQVVSTVTGAHLSATAIDATGAWLIRATTRPDEIAELHVKNGRADRVFSCQTGLEQREDTWYTERFFDRNQPAVVRPANTNQPLVIVQGYGAEIVAVEPPTADTPPSDRWRTSGRGQKTWVGKRKSKGFDLIASDLAGDGRRQILLAQTAPTGCARLVLIDLYGREIWHHDFPQIPGPMPTSGIDSRVRSGGILNIATGRFNDKGARDVLVTVRRSEMHSEETHLLSGRDGQRLWTRTRIITPVHSRGCGGEQFAIADFDGDGLDDAANMYPSVHYILDGATGATHHLIDLRWPDIPTGHVYWSQPVAGFFRHPEQISLLMASWNRSASMNGLLDADGTLIWSDAYDAASYGFPAIGDFDSDGQTEVLFIGFADGSRCYDAATGKVEWTLPLAPDAHVPSAVSGDIDGDGRDEALFSVDRKLYCVSADESGNAGKIDWSFEMPTEISPPILADVRGDGWLSILVTGTDGNLYCLE